MSDIIVGPKRNFQNTEPPLDCDVKAPRFTEHFAYTFPNECNVQSRPVLSLAITAAYC